MGIELAIACLMSDVNKSKKAESPPCMIAIAFIQGTDAQAKERTRGKKLNGSRLNFD